MNAPGRVSGMDGKYMNSFRGELRDSLSNIVRTVTGGDSCMAREVRHLKWELQSALWTFMMESGETDAWCWYIGIWGVSNAGPFVQMWDTGEVSYTTTGYDTDDTEEFGGEEMERLMNDCIETDSDIRSRMGL